MEYILDLMTKYFVLTVIGEILCAAVVIYGFMHEAKFIEFEDKVICVVQKFALRWRKSAKLKFCAFVKRTFLFIYRPYRRMKINICKKILDDYGMKVVRK